MYSSQQYMCSFVVTFWLTIFTYGKTFGVIVWILSDDHRAVHLQKFHHRLLNWP